MEGSPLGSQHQKDQELNVKEWHLRARISRENTSSRRYSASYIRSFREDSRTSFKSNFTISSTTSSPGYNIKEEIDPSTYSFTTALKALQAKSGYVWECYSSPEGFALNSKWDEAERYICNPLSGEVPMECLSSKSLSTPSFRNNIASRVTMSAPLVYSIHPRRITTSTTTKPLSIGLVKEQLVKLPSLRQEEKKITRRTRDVGIQSIPPDEGSSSSPSPASTPSIKERTITRFEESQENEDGDDTQNSSSSIKLNPVEEYTMQVEVKVTSEREETKENKEKEKEKKTCICRTIKGCLQLSSWSSLWMNKRRERKIHAPNN